MGSILGTDSDDEILGRKKELGDIEEGIVLLAIGAGSTCHWNIEGIDADVPTIVTQIIHHGIGV